MSLTRLICPDCGIPLAYCTCYGRAPHPACDYSSGTYVTCEITFTATVGYEVATVKEDRAPDGWQQMKDRVNRLRR